MKSVLTIVVPFTVPWALPYGTAVVNGILKDQGYSTQAWDLSIDLTCQFKHDPMFGTFSQAMSIGGYTNNTIPKKFLKNILKWVKSETKKKIAQCNPDIILLSVFSSQSLDFAIPLSTIIRDIAPSSYIMIGGRGLDNIERNTQLSYGEYFAKYLPVDCTYLGDAENHLTTVLKEQFTGCYVAPAVSSSELINIPAADWSGLEFEKYDGYTDGNLRIPLTASKGCVRQCTFCDVAGSWPKYVFKKGELVGQEVVDLYHKFGINKIEFTDNLVNGSITNFRQMNTVIAEQIPNVIDYLGYAICRPKIEFPESDFELASIAGARNFKIGIESGSERIRNDMKKKFSNDDIDWFAINCAKYNIKQTWLMFCGYPTETEEDFQDTLRLLEKHSDLAQQGKIQVFLSLPMMLTSNSGFMRNYAIDYGLEHNEGNRWSDFFWTSSKYPNNTFEVRVDRWHRFIKKINECGYNIQDRGAFRQTEKIVEVQGLENIFKEYKHANEKQNFIPINKSNFNINQETHL
jgi:radical SAM superfamily enzyme YgiQ (UPF0313 family)